jgi:microcystin-dependent protein
MVWSPNTRFDARVVSAVDLSVKSYIPRWSSIDFSEQLNDVGGGKIVMDFNDSFFTEFNTEYGDGSLFNGTYAIQILREGTIVSTFLIEDSEVQRVGYKQEITIAGRGLAAELEWAVVLPEGYHPGMNVRPIDGEPETLFDREILSYEFLAHCATTSALSATFGTGTVLSTQCLTASSNGSINTSGIDGVTDLIVGSVVLVKNQSNNAHNGIYYVYDTGSAGSPWILARDANFYYEPVFCYVGSKTYVMYGTTNKGKVFDLTACPSSISEFGSSAITYSEATTSYTAISLFYALFKEADEGNEIVTKKGATWGDTRSGYGRGGASKSINWALSLNSTFSSAEGLTDSKGALPKDGGNVSISKGRTLLEVLNTAAEQTECDWKVSPTGVITIVRQPNSTNTVPFGTDRSSGSSALLLPLPNSTSSSTKTSTRDTRSTVFGTNSFLIDVVESSDVLSVTGRRESYIENSSDDTKGVTNIASTALKKISGAKFSVDINFVETENRQAFLDFAVGDKILAEYTIGQKSERIISGISLSVDASLNVSVQLTLNEVIPDSVVSLQNQALYGTSQAQRIKAYLNDIRQPVRASSNVPTPVARVSGLSSGVSLAWNNSVAGNASAYDAEVYRTSEMHRIIGKTRTSNIATLTTAETHSIAVGDKVSVTGLSGYNTTDATVTAVNVGNKTFSYSNTGSNDGGGLVTSETWVEASIPITSITRENGVCLATTSRAHGLSAGNQIIVSSTDNADEFDVFNKNVLAVPTSTTFTYQTTGPDTGDDIAAATTGRLFIVSEFHSQRTPSSQTSAVVENLAVSGRPYYSRIVPINPVGDPGYPSNPAPFFSSIDAMSVVGGAIKSPNYQTGTTGWLINSDGSAEFGNVTVRGTVTSSNITGSTISIGSTATNSFYVDSSGNHWAGNASRLAAPFRVDADGSLYIGGSAYSAGVAAGDIYKHIGGANTTTISGGVITSGTINLSNGVNIQSSGNTARINITSTGLFAYNSSGTNTVAINADGSASFTGAISSSSFTNGTTFAVSSSGGLKVDNILAGPSAIGGSPGLRIVANGQTGVNGLDASTGSIYLYNGLNYVTRIGISDTAYMNIKTTSLGNVSIVPSGGRVAIGGETFSTRALTVNGDIGMAGGGKNDIISYGGFTLASYGAGTTLSIGLGYLGTNLGYFVGSKSSSITIKENISTLSTSQALSDIMALPSVKEFTYIPPEDASASVSTFMQINTNRGFIIEDFDSTNFDFCGVQATEAFDALTEAEMTALDITALQDEELFTRTYWREDTILATAVAAIQELKTLHDALSLLQQGDGLDISGLTYRETPVGTVVPYAGAGAISPYLSFGNTTWLECDGGLAVKDGFLDLYNVLTDYGTVFPYGADEVVDGDDCFRLPNFSGKSFFGFDWSQTDADFSTVGDTGGSKEITLTAAQSGVPSHSHDVDATHSHTASSASAGSHQHAATVDQLDSTTAHGHGIDGSFVSGTSATPDGETTAYVDSDGSHSHTITVDSESLALTTDTVSSAASEAHNNMPPYVVMKYLIKASSN